jgi:hypothetical protein
MLIYRVRTVKFGSINCPPHFELHCIALPHRAFRYERGEYLCTHPKALLLMSWLYAQVT